MITLLFIGSLIAIVNALSSKSSANKGGLIIGVNKYSHDASICIIDSNTNGGSIVFSLARERLTKKKHDGGGVADLIKYGLDSIGAKENDIKLIVNNNHHFRVNPFEARIPYYKSIKYCPDDYDDSLNLLPNVRHLELSHHLAHAWSVAPTAPFDEGLIVVCDGMGEAYKAMIEDMIGTEEKSGDYMHDLKLIKKYGSDAFVGQPVNLLPGSGYREAESAYTFQRTATDGTIIRPVFKRWSRERSPPELYNHGFENMESMGAVYSRISSHLLGDWNACGKVMGLAPWANKKRIDAKDWFFGKENLGLGDDFYHSDTYMSGNPYSSDPETGFRIDWKKLESLPHSNSWSETRFGMQANIAQSIQTNLEDCAMSLVSSLKEATGASNVALTGGVALNSVLNGRVLKSKMFDNTFIPPGPGDEGVAVGCALYGLDRLRQEGALGDNVKKEALRVNFQAYQGKSFKDKEIDMSLDYYSPWLQVTRHDKDSIIDVASNAIASGYYY